LRIIMRHISTELDRWCSFFLLLHLLEPHSSIVPQVILTADLIICFLFSRSIHSAFRIMYSLSRFFQILFAVCVLRLLFQKRRKTKFPLPPGPPRLPIFGNAFDIPLVDMTKTYLGWTKKFGKLYKEIPSILTVRTLGSDIIYLEALGKKTIILNSYDVATELLDKRGHIYSSRRVSILDFVANIYLRINRPHSTFLGELYTFQFLIMLYSMLIIT